MTLVFIITIIIAIVGIINTGYLIHKRRKKKPLVCPINQDCNVVLESKWSKILGIRNDILGLLFYALILIIAVILLFLPHLVLVFYLVLLLIICLGFLFSIFLVFIQAFIIKEFCFYCLISTFLTTLLFVIYLLFYFS